MPYPDLLALYIVALIAYLSTIDNPGQRLTQAVFGYYDFATANNALLF